MSQPPSFLRRFAAGDTRDPDALVALACDESYFVRRQAVQNEATPPWILELLRRAGATSDLRGRGEPDPTMDAESLRRLVECGPWARPLVAEHPNAPADVLDALRTQRSSQIRLAVARHPNCEPESLAELCADAEETVREAAAANPNRPDEAIELLQEASGSDVMATDRLQRLAVLGPWGLFLTARRPECPSAVLERAATDPDWRVRSALLDNPAAPVSTVEGVVLSRQDPPPQELHELAHHESPEVRLAVARHPAAGAAALGLLVSDGLRDVRALAATHPAVDHADIDLLVRAGSTPDLMQLDEPGESVTSDELDLLSSRDTWARLLVVRHPRTGPQTLAGLLCDADPKIREWAAVHQSAPQETIRALIRAGSSDDFQGLAPADPELPEQELRALAQLGPWGRQVVAAHPNAPPDLR